MAAPSHSWKNTSNRPLAIIRRKQVEARTGLARTTIYAKLTPNPKRPDDFDPTFPKPISLGKNKNGKNAAVGWIEAEVEAWIGAQIEKSREAGG